MLFLLDYHQFLQHSHPENSKSLSLVCCNEIRTYALYKYIHICLVHRSSMYRRFRTNYTTLTALPEVFLWKKVDILKACGL